MKKTLFYLMLLFPLAFSAQCSITGADTVQVGERQQYTAEDANACANCYQWTYPDQKIFLEGETTAATLTVKGAVPGTAVLSLKINDGNRTRRCKKILTVIAPLENSISPEATRCDLPDFTITEKRLSDTEVEFSADVLPKDFTAHWTATYRNGDTRNAEGEIPKFPYSNGQPIDKVELHLKQGKCSKKITKIYDSNFWYFF